jgi:hypothetical protein
MAAHKMNAWQGVPTMFSNVDPTQQRILDEISVMRGMSKTPMTFEAAWGMLRQQQPELFDEDRPPATSLATTGQAHTAQAAAEARARTRQRLATVHASRPLNGSDPEAVTVVGGFCTDIFTGQALAECEDGSVREL